MEKDKALEAVQEVSLFTNIDFGDVRAFIDDSNIPWFVAADVCNVLGINNSRDTLAKVLEKWEKSLSTINTPGGPQQVNVVNKGGLYHLIAVSRKPQAKRFKSRLYQEILPALSGMYNCPSSTLNNPNYKQIIEFVPPLIKQYSLENKGVIL